MAEEAQLQFIHASKHQFRVTTVDKEASKNLTIFISCRVHPGETNASYMMEGFIRFITSPTNPEAQELRKRLIFKNIPCTNPDGVIAGNYRVSMSGNDLNRRYQSPHPKLHPIVCAVKKLIKEEKPDL